MSNNFAMPTTENNCNCGPSRPPNPIAGSFWSLNTAAWIAIVVFIILVIIFLILLAYSYFKTPAPSQPVCQPVDKLTCTVARPICNNPQPAYIPAPSPLVYPEQPVPVVSPTPTFYRPPVSVPVCNQYLVYQ